MNIKMFKEKVSELDNYDDKFYRFRTWVVNKFILYRKIYNRESEEAVRGFNDKEQFDYFSGEEGESFTYQWRYISIDAVINLYSEMCWELDDEIKNSKLKWYIDADCLDYEEDFFKLYEKIESIDNDIEFCYALLFSVSYISESVQLYKHYVNEVYRGLSKFDLTEIKGYLEYKKKVFVAMCFQPEMDSAKEAIEQSVEECDFVAIFMNEKQYNNQIVPEIYYEIERSAFIIADLSLHRTGVYYEAGYAHAKGKTVILTCRVVDKEEVHFDLAQTNIIYWKDVKDLSKRLVDRIKSTILV